MIRSLVAVTGDDNEISLRRNIERDELETLLTSEAHRLWLDIIDPSTEDVDWMAQVLKLNPSIVSDLRREDRRPTLLVYPDYLFLSLFQPHIRAGLVEGSEIHCLLTNTAFITVRHAAATSVDGAYDRAAQNMRAWESGVPYFLYLTCQHATDSYYPLLDGISTRLNGLEEKLLNNGFKERTDRPVYRIKQQLINLREMVAPQREVFSSVIGETRITERTETRDLFRHLYERLLRIYDVIDSQRDLSNNVLDMMRNQESRRLVEAMNRLTIFSMIFLPLTFFTSLFELNFATTSDQIILPIDGNVMFFFVVMAMVISAGTMMIVFRRQRWI